MTIELWTMGISLPTVAERMAAGAEAAGWDGMLVVDSQNLAGDSYIALALAAKATERLRLGTGVTNPFTRHPAVTASAISHVQAVSGGRAVLGIGRGDSSLAHLGLAPAPVDVFERYLERLQAYLRGDEVTFDADEHVAGVEALRLAGTPGSSKLEWLRPNQPKVPVDVAGTGPKVLAIGGRVADRVTLAVGAKPERIAWGIEQVRASGRDVNVGAYVNVVAHPDRDVARHLVSGTLSTFARFAVMHGTPTGPVSDEDRETLQRVHRAYDMRHHTWAGSPQAEALDPDFIDRFAVVGPPDEVAGRLLELASLGLERMVIFGPSAGADREAGAEAQRLFISKVMPALRTL